jgi:tyrosyl-tRNA synthetase
MTTPLLEGLDGVEKMSKSLGNYVGVTEAAEAMYAKLLSISDALMWRYYLLLTDLTAEATDAERAAGRPMDSKLALARRVVSDFHGADAAEAAETEWRRIHQRREAPSAPAIKQLPPGPYKPHELLVRLGLASSKSEAVRLLRQKAVKRDGAPLDPAREIELLPGASFDISVGAARYVRVEAS